MKLRNMVRVTDTISKEPRWIIIEYSKISEFDSGAYRSHDMKNRLKGVPLCENERRKGRN